jgi:putative transposase
MSQSLANVLVHLIFSTKNRVALLRPEVESELFPYVATICREHGCPTHQIGGTDDHLHLVCSLSRTISLSNLLQEVKASSSKWIKGKGKSYGGFSWQNGYGAFSIGQSQFWKQ